MRRAPAPKYEVRLEAFGNIDLGEDPTEPKAPASWVSVGTLQEASDVLQTYRDEYDLGHSNFGSKTGTVRLRSTGRAVAYVSYNGRVWASSSPQRWSPQTREITGAALRK